MSKVISVSDETYTRLSRIKNGQSFSRTILKLMDKPEKKSLSDVLKSIGSQPELADSVEEVYKMRDKIKMRKVNL